VYAYPERQDNLRFLERYVREHTQIVEKNYFTKRSFLFDTLLLILS
jgi:hypothetical protein